MTKPPLELYDVDARDDPLLAEYERARDLLQGAGWKQGLETLERLAHQGSLMSMLLVSDAMRTGWMYDQDLPGAEAWYRVAVESGSARGLFGLALTYLQMGRFSEAIGNLEAAITRDFPPAYNALAGIYFRGDGVPVDKQRALVLWCKGAALGHLPAKRNLVRQRLQGHYGFRARIAGCLGLLPVVLEIVNLREVTPYTDRMR
ncbi:MAG: hypothetical protein Q8O54_04010 [Brevundimonas sp.]|nr:hypothetical protein [Brevundimonas sp.]